MEYLDRYIEKQVLNHLVPGKVIVLLGARRVGKTVLMKKIAGQFQGSSMFLNGDDYRAEALLAGKSADEYRSLAGKNDLIMIDEAQKIEDIGRILKIMVDEMPDKRIMVSGSSAFDLSGKIGEPLTGRKSTFYLYPFAQCELNPIENILQTKSALENKLIYGSYPELLLINDQEEKVNYLSDLVSSYLLKDILALDNIKNSSKILNILRLLSYQVGMQVSVLEIANKTGLNKGTVDRYLDLLTKVFVIYKVEGFSRNHRKEISKTCRYYFWDNGVRNILAANFNPVSLRNDVGQLWENYIISERKKWQAYHRMIVNNYFWRTYDQQEIDWVEEREGKLFAYEIKMGNKKVKAPGGWLSAYPDSSFIMINPDNYIEFIS
jgi:predicted AAA+ superfamily ATPase